MALGDCHELTKGLGLYNPNDHIVFAAPREDPDLE